MIPFVLVHAWRPGYFVGAYVVPSASPRSAIRADVFSDICAPPRQRLGRRPSLQQKCAVVNAARPSAHKSCVEGPAMFAKGLGADGGFSIAQPGGRKRRATSTRSAFCRLIMALSRFKIPPCFVVLCVFRAFLAFAGAFKRLQSFAEYGDTRLKELEHELVGVGK
eukprot:1300789-Alexandrium_andersonii.AAC.1